MKKSNVLADFMIYCEYYIYDYPTAGSGVKNRLGERDYGNTPRA